MPPPHGGVVSLGIVFMTVGGLLFLCVGQTVTWFGIAMVLLGFFLTALGLCLAMKSRHVTVPGHFLLQPRTGTCYSRHQATVIQRRLDRIRRAMSEDSEPARLSSPNTSLQNLPGTPPAFDTEPPPSYDTIIKSVPGTVQHV